MENEIEARIRAEIQNAEIRRIASNKAIDLEIADLQTALRVVQGISPMKSVHHVTDMFSATIKSKSAGITNREAILRSLKEFGPLDTSDLWSKVNLLRDDPTTLGTIRVTSSQLKTKGELNYDGKVWSIKANKARPAGAESASKVTDEVKASSNESLKPSLG